VPARKLVHVILDNYAVHKHPKVRQWLARHPRFAFHFTPTSCSWLNAVDGFFAKLAKQRLKRRVFRGVSARFARNEPAGNPCWDSNVRFDPPGLAKDAHGRWREG
jgi:transposase